MKQYPLPIAYAVLLTLCLPFNLLLAFLAFTVFPLVSSDFTESMCVLLFSLYWAAAAVLGIQNIRNSFSLYRQGEVIPCINSMLILKYGMVVFFAVNFIVILILMLFFTLGMFVASRGTMIFAFPVVLPIYVLIVLAAMAFTWLLLVPGAFYGIQVRRLTRAAGKTGTFAALIHGIFQFTFFLDVLDSMYLAVVKYGRGKKSSAVIAVLYILLIIGFIWLGMKLYGLL